MNLGSLYYWVTYIALAFSHLCILFTLVINKDENPELHDCQMLVFTPPKHYIKQSLEWH